MAFSSGTFSRLFDWTTDRDSGIRIRADRFDQELDGFATGLSTTILKDGTQTTTAVVPFAFGISIVDNKAITLGTNSDITIQYDETTNDSLEIAAAVEGAALGIVFKSDQGDDNADQHKLSIADGGTLTLASKISGSFVTYLTHTPNSTVASSTLAVAGNLTVGGNLTLGSGAELSEAELEMLDGITAGTVAASKAVVVDANKDIASFRNITLTGELDAGSLDVSGDIDVDGTSNLDVVDIDGAVDMASTLTVAGVVDITDTTDSSDATGDTGALRVEGGVSIAKKLFVGTDADIDGTLEADAMTLNGSAITTTATLSTGISNGNVLVATSGIADNDFLRVDGTSIEGRSASEVLSDIGGQASLTFGISNTNAVKIDSASVADDEFARFTANGLESRSAAETLSDIGASPVAGSSSIVTTGALDSGSITSGFGNIDTGSSTITTTGVGTFGSLDLNGGELILDADADTSITADTDDQIDIKIGGTDEVTLSSSGIVINEGGNDRDFRIESNDSSNMFVVDGGNNNVRLRNDTDTDYNADQLSNNSVLVLNNETSGANNCVGISFITQSNGEHYITAVQNTANSNSHLTFGSRDGGSRAERMRIKSNGDVFFGVTNLPSSSTGGSGFQVASSNRNVLYLATTITGTSSVAVFVNGNGIVGTIKTSGSATQFNTSSDYRLKENVSYDWDATTRLKQLKPARFNFKADADTTVDGFLAHEVSSIVPEAISGEKDETQDVGTVKDKDGKVIYENVEEYKADKDKEQTWTKTGTEDVYQGIDQSKLVPLLVKTIQELEARVTALESK